MSVIFSLLSFFISSFNSDFEITMGRGLDVEKVRFAGPELLKPRETLKDL